MSGALVDTETGEVVNPERVVVIMSAEDAEAITLKIQQYVGMVCHLVKKAHDEGAWKALGYKSWAAYCKDRFDYSRSHSYRLIGYANTVLGLTAAAGVPATEVSPMGDTFSERALRGIDVDELIGRVEAAAANLPPDASLDTRGKLIGALLDELRAEADESKSSDAAPSAASDSPAAPPAAAGDTSHQDPPPGSDPATGDGEVPQHHPAPGADGSPEVDPPSLGDDAGEGQQEGSSAPSTATAPPAPAEPAVSDEDVFERAQIGVDMRACRALLDRDPAAIVAAMDAENRDNWTEFAIELMTFAHTVLDLSDLASTEENAA